MRSKKECTGYPPPPRAKIYEEKRIAPKPPNGNLVQARTVLSSKPRGPSIIQIATTPPPMTLRALTPPETPKYTALVLHQPSTIPFDSHEGLYFQLFRDYTASELSGFFDSSFWTRRVLQECHSEEAIRHAVVALGALYKTLEKISESPPSSPSNADHSDNASRHWEVAFKHYSLAIRAVVSSAPHDQPRKE